MYWWNHLGFKNCEDDTILKVASIDYIMKNKILRQKDIYSKSQVQTKTTFAFKWSKQETYESEIFQRQSREWLFEKYLGGDQNTLNNWIRDGAKMLDAGCGSGFSTLLLFEKFINRIHYLGVDISDAIDIGKKRFDERGLRAEFLQADLLHLPFSEPTFDIIFAEGVLHHTDSTRAAIDYLSRLLLPGGKFLFYVYRKKAPIREFCDDYIRHSIRKFDDEQAWERLMPLTKLGKMLGDLNITVNVPEEIPFLKIPKGPINLQRLFYWYLFKAYYKSDFSLEEMNHINFDWYRPLNCHRHTPQEVEDWCMNTGLNIQRFYVDQAGIAVVAIKH